MIERSCMPYSRLAGCTVMQARKKRNRSTRLTGTLVSANVDGIQHRIPERISYWGLGMAKPESPSPVCQHDRVAKQLHASLGEQASRLAVPFENMTDIPSAENESSIMVQSSFSIQFRHSISTILSPAFYLQHGVFGHCSSPR